MKKPPVRLALVLLAIAAVAGAGYFAFGREQRAASLRSVDRLFAEEASRLQATLWELRAAQAGYLATGQDTATWIGKVQQLRQQAEAQLERLARAGGGQETELASVAESLAAFGRFDERTQAALRDEQPLAASTLIFGDAAQLLSTASHSLSTIRGARAAATGADLAALQRQAVYAAAGAGVLVLLVLVLLLPAGQKLAAAGVQEPAETAAAFEERRSILGPISPPSNQQESRFDFDLSLPPREQAHSLDLASEPREVMTDTAAHTGPTPAAVAPRQHHQPAQDADRDGTNLPVGGLVPPVDRTVERHAEDVAGPVDLAAAARLCTDLARVHDTSELQGLLGRAASLLNASGIVVWMGSEKGDVLWPAFSHGYSPHAMARMQALPRDAATPVSVAYRKGLMEVVPAADGASGAIVAPILTAGGCVGAMAVEVAASSETSEAAQALACIVAAQLATLVAGESQ